MSPSFGRIAGLVLLLWSHLAAAQRLSPAQGKALRQHADQGSQAFAEGRYQEAIRAFEAAYALRPDPVLVFNIANACRKAGRLEDAIVAYERFLAMSPPQELATEARGNIGELRARLELQRAHQAEAAQAASLAQQQQQQRLQQELREAREKERLRSQERAAHPLPSEAPPLPRTFPLLISAASAQSRLQVELPEAAQRLRCEVPCRLSLPPGPTLFNITGDARFERSVLLPARPATLVIDKGQSGVRSAGILLLTGGLLVGALAVSLMLTEEKFANQRIVGYVGAGAGAAAAITGGILWGVARSPGVELKDENVATAQP